MIITNDNNNDDVCSNACTIYIEKQIYRKHFFFHFQNSTSGLLFVYVCFSNEKKAKEK